eukprot:TRINITY_DN64958_c0_g1_i1.p1 TRINITY_DN64958_c0_g1~~TRINITY_DN64958_c0_g1_i1.p1  ORF type:complete len:224 (+),score=19.93 TRINITY_DN64958_c0_g1_i1:47-673(+)
MKSSMASGCLLVCLWAPLGFLHGSHWIALACAKSIEPRQRRLACGHGASYWAGFLVTALGGGWCRSGVNVACPGGEDMSRACLWAQQTAAYQVIYTAHYISLAWICTHWVMDGCHIVLWARQGSRGEPLRLLCDGPELGQGRYAAVVAIAVLLETLTWTGFYDWSTADESINSMALVLLLEMVAVLLTACVLLRFVRSRSRGAVVVTS